MDAPKRKCCGKRHWEIEGQCPSMASAPRPVSPAVSPVLEAMEPVSPNIEADTPEMDGTNTERDRKRRWRVANPGRYRDYQRTYMAKRRALSTSE